MRDYSVLDVFTDVPLEGNPVAIFTDGAGLSNETMQRAARELNLSETVFLLAGEEGADAHARIFTPYVELPFAGHPVLGTAFLLGERSGAETVRLQTGSGLIRIALERRAGTVVYGEMQQPIPRWQPYDRTEELLAALGVADSGLPVEVYDNGPRFAFVELADEWAVASLRPDMRALAELGEIGVSCLAVAGDRVKTRMFGPGLGVAEDPATGSAAGPLAVHLARHGRTEWGQRIAIRQGAEIGRPSLLEAVAEGSAAKVERVTVGGCAVPVATGEYRLD
ncbi:MAG TPA: PhzF family phenazine biosynthesis protein [Solirubrobacteraceae bacterium]|nr:PhzF family phenazine biosynthesis protein [Solirubrobacteraceae bacterium]